MARPPRQLLDHGCYHLIARGNNRQFLFTEPETFQYFLDLLARAQARYPAKLYHYCLMSNHIHLLLAIAQGDQLPKFMPCILQGYARWFGKLVPNLKDYPWSSYPFYAYGMSNPLLTEDPYYAQLGAAPSRRQTAYQDFVRIESPYAPILDTELVESPF